MGDRTRVAIFAALVAVCLGIGVVAVLGAAGGDDSEEASANARTALTAARDKGTPMVLYRQERKDLAGADGAVEAAPAATPTRGVVTTGLSCARVAFASGHGICLARQGGFAQAYRVKVFGPDFKIVHQLPVAGVPSRARVSPDGRYGSVTTFVTGHSYAAAGAFSTATTLVDMATGAKIADLEQFQTTDHNRQVTAVDINYWGVTFAKDSDTFYATMATGGKTFLIRGSVSERSAVVLHENVECPSLSPDQTRVAYKKRVGDGSAPWRLYVLDLKTMRETPLAETRSVDDQVEWRDDAHVLYGVDGAIWTADADGGGRPARYVAAAASPGIVRW